MSHENTAASALDAARTHKQVIVLRKDLKMRYGKGVSQGCHASWGSVLTRAERRGDWLCIPLDADIGPWLDGLFTKACVSVPDEASLKEIHARALAAGLPCELICDSGLTEFHGIPTLTAVAVGPALRERVDKITGDLPLL